jgi:hypothetical protein
MYTLKLLLLVVMDRSTSKIEEQLVAHEYVPASFRQPELLAIEPRVSCLGQNGAVRVSIL